MRLSAALKEGGEFRGDEISSPNGGRCGASCLAPKSDGEGIEARHEFKAGIECERWLHQA